MRNNQRKRAGRSVRRRPAGRPQASGSVRQAVRRLSESVRQAVHGRPWTAKAARNARNNRTVPLWRQVVPGLLIVEALGSTLIEADWQTQAIMYLAFGSAFFFCDPLAMLTRMLAPQSCRLMAFCQVLAIIAIIRPSRGYLAVAGILVSVSLTAVKFCNVEWLAAYNWLLSAEVEAALLWDAENRATKAWESHGRREMRTLLHELGFEATDANLNIFARPMYLCGYLQGHQKMSKVKQKIEKLEIKTQVLSDNIKKLQDSKADLQKQLVDVKQDAAEIEANLKETRYAYESIQKMYAASQSENRRLRAANEELVQAMPDPIPDELSEDEQIRQLLQDGLSIRKIAEVLQIPKNRVERVKKNQDSNDKIVVLGEAN